MNFLIGFLIAAAVGLTGIGGGSFTVPALVLLAGLTAGDAVGTAFLFVASPARSSSRPSCGHLGASFVESRSGKSSCNPAAGCSLGGVIKRDLYQARAKSHVRRKEPSLASLARFADWTGVGILVRRCWSAGNRSSVELFRNDACPSCWNRFAFWIGIGGHRQRFSLEFWLNQHADTSPTSTRWCSWSGAWMLAGAESSCEQAEDGGRHSRHHCRVAACVDRKPRARRKTRDEHREDRWTGTCRPCSLANLMYRKNCLPCCPPN